MAARVELCELLKRNKIAKWLDQNQTGIVLLPLLSSAICIVVEKIATMKKMMMTLAAFGSSLSTSYPLKLTEKAALFRSDMLWGLILIPLAFCVATFWMKPRARVYAAFAITAVIQVVVVTEILGFLTSGTFPSLPLIWFAVSWSIRNHDAAFAYHPYATALLAGVDLLFVVLVSAWSLRALRRNARRLNRAVLAVFIIGAVTTGSAWALRVPPMPWSQPLLKMTVVPFVNGGANTSLDSRSIPELIAAYRHIAHVPAPKPTIYTGQAKGYNVIVFIMESMTEHAFDPARDSLDDMPNMRRLRGHSFVMSRHYTTYPLTDNATFSIYTSLYIHRDQGVMEKQAKVPSMIRSLNDDGYATAFYGFVWNSRDHHDYPMLASVGFEKIAASPFDPEFDPKDNETFFGPVDYVEKNDHDGLLSMMKDIRAWTAHGQKFAVNFSPEIGHDPYRLLDGSKPMPELERAHALAVLQDAWMGELLDELQRDKALNHTIIVVTGDHGMRIIADAGKKEFRFAVHTTLSDATLRVPMMIYAPGILKKPVVINTPTSHIDVMPTVLDLLGVTNGRELEQGSPMYAPGLNQRRLFLGMDLMGATGYYDQGYYYSSNVLGMDYKAPTLSFDQADLIPFDSAEARMVMQPLATHVAIEHALIDHVLSGN